MFVNIEYLQPGDIVDMKPLYIELRATFSDQEWAQLKPQEFETVEEIETGLDENGLINYTLITTHSAVIVNAKQMISLEGTQCLI